MRLWPLLLLLSGEAGAASFTVQESGQGFARLGEAVSAIGDASGTIIVAPGRYRDCAVQIAGSISYVAERPGTAIFDGGICEGKAALVLRGRSARVDGLTFRNLRVADGNGAGIRLEHGDLLVSGALFENSESGILSGDDEAASIKIERSTFSGLGRCDRDLSCAHSIYIGNYGSLSVVRSRFERGTGGHYVKSRAARIDVRDSSFDDSGGHTTNYMIDLSNGATGTIAGNMFVQGRDKENYSAFIVTAAEGVWRSSAGLQVTGNDASLAPGVDRNTAFVADLSGDPIRVEGNKLGKTIERFQKR
jgi:hypothetical protein